MVIGPSLPINIINTIINLLNDARCGVIPVDNPTVPKALVTSNSNCINELSGSNIHKIKVPIITTKKARITRLNAFHITLTGNFLLNAPQCLLVELAYKLLAIIKAVVVFTPPPVDPGDAPININITNVNNPAFVKVPKLYVLNPAVLAEVLKKNAPSQDIFSVIFKRMVPTISNKVVINNTTFVWRQNFLKDLFSNISFITKKPSPPKIIRKHVVKFKRILLWYGMRFCNPPNISNPELLNAAMEWKTLIPKAFNGS